MKRSIKIIVLFLTLLLLYACFKPQVSEQFYPTQLNNNWEYERKTYYPFSVDTIIVSINKIISNDSLPTSEVAVQGWRKENYTSKYSTLLFSNENGLNYTGFSYYDSIGIHEPQLVYKFPVEIGESWVVKEYNLSKSPPYYSGISERYKYSCVATDEIFVSGVDTFLTTVYHHCSLWAGHMFHAHYFEYLSYGIGNIGTEIYYSEDTTYTYSERKNEDLHFSERLIDYCLY
ncbi:MAG: hypothetical protein KAT14_02930 [Candidatus Marinimicrobia bacterium]|nr:hypothetical protein [Candidatus Neomarinimicrobiota bacterium]